MTKTTKLRISVSDSGIGLSSQNKKHIFQAFHQADASIARKYGGTGLGLTICKKIVDQLSGKIGVDSKHNEGSVFWFTFSVENTTSATPLIQSFVPLNDLKGIRILCVDDNISNANLIAALLQHTHAEITLTHDGIDAVKLTEKQAFDIILMDIRMPHMDGYETLTRIRETNNFNSNTPIIALSAHISSSEARELKEFGFNEYLTKPILKSILIKTIIKFLKKPEDLAPIIDWEAGLKLANNRSELAEEMLNLLVKGLPEEFAAIKQAYEVQNQVELLRLLHKLHGAVCYCGVPRLKNAIAALESSLKQAPLSEAVTLFVKVEFEVNELCAKLHETK